MRRMHAAAASLFTLVVAATTGCSKNVVTLTPSPTMRTTYDLNTNQFDVNNDCSQAVPPAPTVPSPAAGEMLVGYQDWRNTYDGCTTSKAHRWEAAVTFDMSAVVAEMNKAPMTSLTGTLDFSMPSTMTPTPTAGAVDLCARTFEWTATPATANGLVNLQFSSTTDFPTSAASTLGVQQFPTTSSVGAMITKNGITVDDRATTSGRPRVSVPATLVLSDWANTKPSTITLVIVPRGPLLGTMGMPVPTARAAESCISRIQALSFTVNVAH